MRRKSPCLLCLLFLLFSAAPLAWPAGVSIPRLELLSVGGMEADLFVIKSKIFLDMAFDGGSKFSGSLKFALNSGYLEEDFLLFGAPVPDFSASPSPEELAALGAIIDSSLSLDLKTVSVTIRELFGAPLDFSYFVGTMESFCSGDDFVPLFAEAPFSTAMRGYISFPEGLAGNRDLVYEGIHTVKGSGLKLHVQDKTRLAASLYLYQDMYLGPGRYSADIRFLLNNPGVKLDIFAGASLPASSYGLYRAGLLVHVPVRGLSGFYAQIGIPYLDPAQAASFGIRNFYFLFEPRLSGPWISFIPTFFYHPAYYLQAPTGEEGILDFNLNLKFGKIERHAVEGGAECLLSLDSFSTSSPFAATLSPYIRFSSGGAVWDAKISARLYPFDTTDILSQFNAYFGVKTGF